MQFLSPFGNCWQGLCSGGGRAIPLCDKGLWQHLPSSACSSVGLCSWCLFWFALFSASSLLNFAVCRKPQCKRKAELGGSSLWMDVCLGLPHGVWELSTDALCREGHCGLCWVCSLLWFDPSTPQQELVMDPVWLQCRQNHGLE